MGTKELRKGEDHFFLQPGENLEDGTVKDIYILGNDEALLVKAKENFTKDGKVFPSGEKWNENGPCRYIPDIKVEVIEKRRNICLDKNEGIYIRDTREGDVKLISGTTYLLKSHEELWSMKLNRDVDRLLTKANGVKRNSETSAVTFQIPFNSAC